MSLRRVGQTRGMGTIRHRGISKQEASFGEILINSIHLIELIFCNSRSSCSLSLSWASFSSSSLTLTTPATPALAWAGDPCLGDAPSNCPVSMDWAVAMSYSCTTSSGKLGGMYQQIENMKDKSGKSPSNVYYNFH
jgi:hypothetical protein